MKIYLCNDTTGSGAGCNSVMRSIKEELIDNEHEIIAIHQCGTEWLDDNKFMECDAVIVNGEGTMHSGNPYSQTLLSFLKLGQDMGKKTYLINSVFQFTPFSYHDVLAKLDLFAVRDALSYECGIKCGGNPVAMIDSSFLDMQKHDGNSYAELSGIHYGFIRKDSPASSLILDYTRLGIGMYEPDHQKFLGDVAETLKSCDVYVTGQHHGIYAAAFAGIPFVSIPSNTYKIEGLLLWFHNETGMLIPIARDYYGVETGIKFARASQYVYDAFRAFLMSKNCFTGDLIHD